MIHLEIQPDLEASCTIRGMKRTFARVGIPGLMISDNHKTYRSGKVRNFARERGIKWRNILDLSPNWGGFYERMNSIIKAALRKTLKNAHLSYEELETVVIEIEAVINSRPLSYLQDHEILEPLTPSHLMYGRRLKTQMRNCEARNSDEISPNKCVQYVNRLLEQYWKRFSTEYLTSLRERQLKGGNIPAVKINQVVLVKQKYMPRNSWNLGKVIRIICSPDGVPKGAEIRTGKGILKRPLHLLCPIEMHPDDDHSTQRSENDDLSNDTSELIQYDIPSDSPVEKCDENKDVKSSSTARRMAAVTGELKRRLGDSRI